MWSLIKRLGKARDRDAEELRRILNAYGDVLMRKDNPVIMDESRLPGSKNIIKKAIWAAIATTDDTNEREQLRGAYLFLSSFQPGAGPKGIDPLEDRFLAFAERMETESKALERELQDVEEELKRRGSA